MPRDFDVPEFYRSPTITEVKRRRAEEDPKRRNLSPSVLNYGDLQIKIARHFGFCYGVENAIDIAYRAISENPNKRIFLLSEMIHNPQVNADLAERGVRFLMDTNGKRLFPFSELTAEDIVIVPAFGTTVELQSELKSLGINPDYYDTTCPFVEKVWRRAHDLGERGFAVVIHGKRTHEETRATFSHSKETAPSIVVRDMEDTAALILFMQGTLSRAEFETRFAGAYSDHFNPDTHLSKLGVVNQTTMLATETQAIATALRQALVEQFGSENISQHFADTRDTLCYATYENQSATKSLIDSGADIALVVGGYKSSNTSHLVELLEQRMPTYYVESSAELISANEIRHFELKTQTKRIASGWLPAQRPLVVALTSGASCPDSAVERVIERLRSFFPDTENATS